MPSPRHRRASTATWRAHALLGRAESLGLERAPLHAAARVHSTRAALALAGGDVAEAEGLAHEALTIAYPQGFLWEIVSAVELLVQVSAEHEQWSDVARTLGACHRLRADHSFVLDLDGAAAALEAAQAASRAALGADGFEAAFSEGLALDREAFISYLQRARGARGRPKHGWDSLTPAELEVVAKAAEGLTNPAIGKALFMSLSTVKTHLGHVYAKLGVTTRTELVRLVVDRDGRRA